MLAAHRHVQNIATARAHAVTQSVVAAGLVAATLVGAPRVPELFEQSVNAQAAPTLTVTGVAPNHSSAKIYFQPVAGAKDYRIYDVSAPTNVKYAGMTHLTASPACPGAYCLHHFVTQSDGVTPVFPYRVASGASGGPQALDVPATSLEWNSLGDSQPHTLVVEAVDQLGPVPQGALYSGAQTTALLNPTPPGTMLGSNKGPTGDGNISTNGQGPYTNRPRVIARSPQFVVQARQDLKPVPSRQSATQSFLDTFENAEGTTIRAVSRQDSPADSFGNLGTMTFAMNSGTLKEWTIDYRQADNTNSMPFVSGDHFMDMLFDGATPGTSAPAHTIYGSMAMTPRQTANMSSGKVLHMTMEVDGHQSLRRWLAFELSPQSDPLRSFDPDNRAINTTNQGLFLELRDGMCTLDIFTGPAGGTQKPTGTAGGSHGARLWGLPGSVGGAPIMCGGEQMYNAAQFSRNGLGHDDRSRYDLFVTQTHAALFQDGRLVIQSDIPAGSFPWANVPLNAYYTHYLYHSEQDQSDLKTVQFNGAGMCYPMNSYWFNDPVNGTSAGSNVCNTSYPAGYGFPYSDERHWDNMGFEVLPASDVPPGNDFSAFGSSVQPARIQAPQFGSAPPAGSSTSTATPTRTPTTAPAPPTNTPVPPTNTPVPPTNTPAPTSPPPTVAPSGQTGQWTSINPPGVSLDFNNPHDNYGFNTVVTDRTRTGTVYMGTNYQGLYRSTDGGARWAKINTGSGGGMLDQGRIWSLALDPFNANTLYAASGYGAGGPLKSTDGGVSWTHTLPSTNSVMRQIGSNDIYNVAVDPYTPNHLLVSFHSYWYGAQDSGLLESFDGGANWTIRNPPPGSGWAAGNTIWFLNNSQTWLLGSQSAGLWRTTNAGQSWTKVSGSNIAHGGIYALYRNATTGVLYVGVWNGILTSTDNGATWRPFIAGLPYAAFDTVFGDGANLYTAPGFPVGGDNGQAHGPWYTAPENGSSGWRAYNTQQPCYNGVCNGPVHMAMDRDGSIYSVNWDAGIFKLQGSGAPSPAAMATSVPATPVPATATPTPTGAAAQPAFTSSASASPQVVARGSSVAMTVSINSTTATNTLIDLEVYDASGAKVFQQWWDGQAFAAGQTRTYSSTWSVAGLARTGTYTVKIGVFAPGWSALYHWNNSATTFSVT